ncbi:MAG TPA: hypothetical protein VGS61_00335, partial [Acidimicrobiales bacterium]|nr:hypothetical protein [Acidimicrobiales bacterium]
LTLPKNVKESSSVVAFFQRSPFHLHTLTPSEGTAVSALAVAICLLAAHRLWRRGLPVSSAIVVVLASSVGPPVAWDHYFVFLPLLVFVAWEAGAGSPLGWVAIGSTVVALVPWINFRAPRATTGWATTYSTVAQNALLVASLAVVVAALSRRARGPDTVGDVTAKT